MNPVIDLEAISKSYRGTPVLDALSLRIEHGVFAMLGPNGAGKTTLVSILTTLVRPDSGTARIHGVDVVRQPAEARRLIGVTGQSTALDDMLTGIENLVLVGRLLGLGRREAAARASALIDQFELGHVASRQVKTYSGGTRRRLDIAASVIDRPSVLFLDEPTTGLDPTSRARMWRDIEGLADAGTTVFLTTQHLDEAEALADRIAVLRDGGIVADGTAKQLTQLVGAETLVVLDGDDRVVRQIETDGTAAGASHALSALTDVERRMRVELRRPSLDDAFIALTTDAASTVADTTAQTKEALA